jgi:hypothetical protein
MHIRAPTLSLSLFLSISLSLFAIITITITTTIRQACVMTFIRIGPVVAPVFVFV